MTDDTLTLGCAHCGAINRIPAARRADGPRCGKCKRPLFEGTPITLTAANFSAVVERSQMPVVVDFWAGWCGPCKMMAPVFAQAAARLEPDLRFAKLDTEAEPALAGRFGIRSIPTLMVFREGRELARQAGALPQAQLEQWLAAYRL
ncbi:thioredoxin TrxC [Alloalcanivorax sp. C16-1]|uniref:thioredoxin TrxC n=1 Tax=Alloalcanivorax sp. C16-1 TaxID=3390051 RepID=UPI003970921C